MGTCSSSLFANKAALMLSIEAVRYIIRISPCTGAVSVSTFEYFEEGKGSFAPFDRKRLRAAIFLLRLCTSLSVFGCLTSVMAFTFEGLARIPCLVMRCPKNRPSSMPKEHFFELSFMLIDRNFLKVSLISANIYSSDHSLNQKASLGNRRPLLVRRRPSYLYLLLPFESGDNPCRRPRSISVGTLRVILPSSLFQVGYPCLMLDLSLDFYLWLSLNHNGYRDPCHVSIGPCEEICMAFSRSL
ncbi:hypothetical protein Tco_0508683 [Tanacetum coccineum]